MAELKTQKNTASIDEFLNTVDDPDKQADCRKLVELMQNATGDAPTMWGKAIVGFGSYHYRYESGREGDWFLVGFSPRKREISVYIMPGFSQYDDLMDRLGKHKTGKSCLYIKRLADIDLAVLDQLIQASVKHMRQTYG